MKTITRPRKSVSERFWGRVDKSGGPEACWIWTGYTSRRPGHNYGTLQLPDGPALAHRLSYELHHGAIPAGKCVLHTCDNPPCVNPAHLWLGTLGDNNRDRARKGRNGDGGIGHPEARPRGERHHMTFLTEADVLVIRQEDAAGVPHRLLASRYQTSMQTIWRICRRVTWAHVP